MVFKMLVKEQLWNTGNLPKAKQKIWTLQKHPEKICPV